MSHYTFLKRGAAATRYRVLIYNWSHSSHCRCRLAYLNCRFYCTITKGAWKRFCQGKLCRLSDDAGVDVLLVLCRINYEPIQLGRGEHQHLLPRRVVTTNKPSFRAEYWQNRFSKSVVFKLLYKKKQRTSLALCLSAFGLTKVRCANQPTYRPLQQQKKKKWKNESSTISTKGHREDGQVLMEAWGKKCSARRNGGLASIQVMRHCLQC